MRQAHTSLDGRRRRGAASRDKALGCAVGIAQIEGLEGLSFGQVAANAGTPKSSLQMLFGDRETLQLQTLAFAVATFAKDISDCIAQSRVPSNQPLLRLCLAWFDVVAHDETAGGCLLTAVVSEYRGRCGPIPSAIHKGQSRWIEALREAAVAGTATSEIDPSADVEQLVFELQAFQGAANVAAAMKDWKSFDRARAAVAVRIASDAPKIGTRR